MSLKDQRKEKRDQNKRVKMLRSIADQPISRSKAEESITKIDEAISNGEVKEAIWTKVAELHRHALGIFASYAATKDVIGREDVKNNHKLVAKLSPMVNAFVSDLIDLKTVLDGLHKLHEGKLGVAETSDDYFEALDISMRYNAWIEQAGATAGSLSNDILALIASSLPQDEGDKIVQEIDG